MRFLGFFHVFFMWKAVPWQDSGSARLIELAKGQLALQAKRAPMVAMGKERDYSLIYSIYSFIQFYMVFYGFI